MGLLNFLTKRHELMMEKEKEKSKNHKSPDEYEMLPVLLKIQ